MSLFQPLRSGVRPAERLVVGGSGEAFQISGEAVVRNKASAMLLPPLPHGDRLDLVGGDEIIQEGSANPEVVGDLLRTEPFRPLQACLLW